MVCRWMLDEVCCNAACPYCAERCPVAEHQDVCTYSEGGDYAEHKAD